MDKPSAVAALKDSLIPGIVRVLRRRRELKDVWTLELEGGNSSAVPGQFNMLYAMGVGEIPISFSGNPSRPYQVHTIRTVGPVSRALAGLKTGDLLGVRGPFGTGWPIGKAKGKDIVVVAGGIGLAPLRPVLYHLFANPKDYGRVSLLYGTRGPGDILYRRELSRWQKRSHVRVEVTVDHAVAGWEGPVGVVTTLITPDLFDPTRTIAMICGPEVMMRFTCAALMDLGLTPESIYLSMERNMKCAIGHCGHCQYGPKFICKDGPVFRFDEVRSLFAVREL